MTDIYEQDPYEQDPYPEAAEPQSINLKCGLCLTGWAVSLESGGEYFIECPNCGNRSQQMLVKN